MAKTSVAFFFLISLVAAILAVTGCLAAIAWRVNKPATVVGETFPIGNVSEPPPPETARRLPAPELWSLWQSDNKSCRAGYAKNPVRLSGTVTKTMFAAGVLGVWISHYADPPRGRMGKIMVYFRKKDNGAINGDWGGFAPIFDPIGNITLPWGDGDTINITGILADTSSPETIVIDRAVLH